MEGTLPQPATVDGWYVHDPERFRFFADHAPPRPFSYVSQVAIDARNWRVWALWFMGAGAVALGLSRAALTAILGVGVIGVYLFRLHRTVRALRCSRFETGTVTEVVPHPGDENWMMSVALTDEGKTVRVVMARDLVTPVISAEGTAVVAFLDDPNNEYASVIGVRPPSE